jgi:hypothetical protein
VRQILTDRAAKELLGDPLYESLAHCQGWDRLEEECEREALKLPWYPKPMVVGNTTIMVMK